MQETRVQSFVSLVVTWFGCGRAPKAPGTFGTLGAIPVVWAFSQMGDYGYLGATMVLTVFAMVLAGMHEAMTGVHDAPEVVIDEVAGFLVTMALVPWSWPNVLLGFAIFRLLDIVKPFPISWVDKKIPGGVGAVADDLVAGILGNIIFQLLLQKGLLPW
jgi:phosphatidylglycerophosphatase A